MSETVDRQQDVRLAELLGLPVRWDFPPYVGMGLDLNAKYPWLKGAGPDGCYYDWSPVVEYGRSLDTMHAVETELARRGLQDEYGAAVIAAVLGCDSENEILGGSVAFPLLHASAQVRRDAAIRVLEAVGEKHKP